MSERYDLWRIVASPRFSSSLIEIQTQWTMADVWDANVYLDIQEDVETYARKAYEK